MALPSTPLFDPLKKAFPQSNEYFNSGFGQQSGPFSAPATPASPNQSVASSLNYTPAPAPVPNQNSGASPYTVKGGDTLSGIAGQNKMSLKDLLALNPQYQSNPNLIRPGESISLSNGGQNFTPDPNSLQYTPVPGPQAFSPAPNQSFPIAPNQSFPTAPNQSFPNPTAPTTSTGQTINPTTGGIVAPPTSTATPTPTATPTAASTPTAGAGTPATPSSSSGATGYDAAVSAYESNLELTPEEIANQEEINRLEAARRKAFTGEGDRPIALEFITGRQKSSEQRTLDLAAPLQAKAALMQAKRTGALEASKFRLGLESDKLDRADAKEAAAKKDDFTLSEGQQRFDAQGNPIAANIAPEGAGGIDPTNDYKNWQLAGAENTGMSFAQWQGKSPEGKQTTAEISKTVSQIGFLTDTATQALELADHSGKAGFKIKAGDTLIGDTKFRQLEALTDTLRTNVLTLVTDPSIKKFFGPQMSEADVRLMTAAGTTLNVKSNSPAQMKTEITRLQALFTKIQTSLQEAQKQEVSSGVGAGGEFDWN